MKTSMYSLFDRKVGAYSQPFYAFNHQVAQRCLRGVVSDHRSIVAQSPADFDLYFVGEFDDASALVVAAQPPVHVCNAVAVLSDDSSKKE